MMKRHHWSNTLTTLSDFATAVGLPMATRDSRSSAWSGVGVCCSEPDEYGRVKLAMRAADESEWPIGSLTKPVPLSALPMLADTIVQCIAWRDQLPATAPVTPVVRAVETVTKPNRKPRCPRCSRVINGEFLPCQCPPDEVDDATPATLLAHAAKTLRKAESRITAAASTARLEPFERRDLKDARGDIRVAVDLIERATTITAPTPDIDVFDLGEVA